MIELLLIVGFAVAVLYAIVLGLLKLTIAFLDATTPKPGEDRSILEFLSLLGRKIFFAIVIALILWASWRGCRM